MNDELRKTVLEAYLKHTESSSTAGLWGDVIAEELGLDKTLVSSEVQYLIDDEYLEKIKIDFGDKEHAVGIRITSKGKKALRTLFNPKWVTEQEKQKENARKLKQRELDQAESSSKWTKIGVVAAILIGLASLVYSILLK